MARLDRLAPVKEIAQIGAAIGREFSYRLLEAVSPIAGPALQDALRQLMASELVYGRGAPPEATYVFKHALVQDTAYASLLRSRRQRIHADIARALAERFADQVEAAPAIIAHHYTEAGIAEPAARYWLKAAELALSRSANAEADRYVDAGLALIPRLKDGPSRSLLNWRCSWPRGNALPTQGLYGTRNDGGVYRSQTSSRFWLGQRFAAIFGAHWSLRGGFFLGGIGLRTRLARQIVEVAERQGDTIYRMVGYRLLGMVLVFAGQNREALDVLQKCDKFRDATREKKLSYRFGTDPGLAALSYKAWALWMCGQPDEADRSQPASSGRTPRSRPSTIGRDRSG